MTSGRVYFKMRGSSNDSFRLSIQYSVRPSRAERIEIALALPCFFSSLATKLFTSREYDTNCCTLPKRPMSWISYRMTIARIGPIPGTVYNRPNACGSSILAC